ncbi:oxidoreductase, partial [Streptomyces sp. SID10116]|nr:oxidoreductase [Streptomyces sp. SID10116]
FAAADVPVAYVDGLAPIVPLLVAQIEDALDRSPQEQRRLTHLAAGPRAAELDVTSTCRVQLTAYRMDRLSRTHVHEVFDEVLEPGRHRVPLAPRTTKGTSYVVARTSTHVLVTPTSALPG